ncbi:hypothetical protein HNQ60_003604 [Povalibacter uvarum]|uniref:DUF3089 domain-containing protein n=1 Tax=Povalibacter uvarum TaxID=732238 RepID=A0A841HNL3_9GAMM|nr:DUF3089 domain-containing protein [Povalibacter uvarum]MBB6094717.1 hypothetical protein [Povalibacter uvarum]
MSRLPAAAIVAVYALLASSSFAQAPDAAKATAPAPQPANDYAKAENWLCRPDRDDACSADLTTTVVAADGALSIEKFTADPRAPIDCFYIYPTVSRDVTGNSDMVAGPEERSVVQHQFARFGSKCRLYAPLYRQITLTALQAMIAGKVMPMDRTLGYDDVVDAWNYYLKNDNKGRGVVLVGHSQGSSMLTQLIAREIEGKPVRSQVVSALLLGWNVAVPVGKDVGGSFKEMPLCRSASQTGCVISYASFRSNVPPPSNTRFGKVPGDNMMAACTNPAALAGGHADLHAYLGAARGSTSAIEPAPWVTPPQKIDTPFVAVPGLLSAECVWNEHGSYLEVTVAADPKDPRVDDIVGDVVAGGKVQADWGLHLIDANLAMGDLLNVVAEQSKAYTAKK